MLGGAEVKVLLYALPSLECRCHTMLQDSIWQKK